MNLQLSNVNKTDLVPQTVLGYNNASQYISIDPSSGIVFYNSTSNITATIAWTGIGTTNPTGFDIISSLNMNSNDITNLDTLSSTTGNPLTISSDDIIYLNSTNNTQINTDSSFTAVAGDNIILTATNDAMTLTADDAITLTSVSNGIIFTTGDLANSGVVSWNSYPMSMTFFNKWISSFTYPITGTDNWDIVRTNTITFPTQFLYGYWAVSFSINCWSVGSAPSDKALAMYFDFFDGNSNTYTGLYKQENPFANWFQPSQYTNTSQNPLSITYTDYFDFTGAINNLELRLWWYGDQPQNQNFNVSTTFTLMTLI